VDECKPLNWGNLADAAMRHEFASYRATLREAAPDQSSRGQTAVEEVPNRDFPLAGV